MKRVHAKSWAWMFTASLFVVAPHCSVTGNRWVNCVYPYSELCLTMKRASQVAQWVKNLPARQEMQETQVQSLGWEDPLEEEMATHPSSLAWRIPWTEEPSGLQFMGLQKRRTWLKWLSMHARYSEKGWINGTTWMNLKIIMLNKRSQTRQSTCCKIPFVANF